MRRTLFALLLAGTMGSGAFAGLDPATDSFGVYFDTAGNTNCTTAGAFQLVTAYLIIMNPAGPTNGFECSVTMAGAPHFILSASFSNCGTDPDWWGGPDDYVCGAPSYFSVPENGALVVVTWSILLQSSSELLFRIGPASIPSMPGGLPVLTGNGVLRLGAVASGDVSMPVAGINAGNCPVSEEVNAFGALKSLFR